MVTGYSDKIIESLARLWRNGYSARRFV